MGVAGVQQRNQIGAVIHGDDRLMIERGAQMAVVGFVIFAFDRVGRNLIVLDQRCRDIVLGRQRIGSAEQHVGAAGFESLHQVRGLGGDMQTSRKTHAAQRLFLGEAFFNPLQHRHILAGPENPLAPAIGQTHIFYIVFLSRHFVRFPLVTLR